MGLLDTKYQDTKTKGKGLLSKAEGKVYKGKEFNPMDYVEMASMSMVPGVSDAASGLLAARDFNEGNYGSAALNAVGVLPFIPALGMVTKGRGYKNVPDLLKSIDDEYKATGKLIKPGKVEVAVLSPEEMNAFNSGRQGAQPKLKKPELGYNGRHHYNSRGPTPEGNGYLVSDMEAQLDSVTSGDLSKVVDRSGVALQQKKPRNDGYGKSVKDKMVVIVDQNGAGEITSVIPVGDGLNKGEQVQRGLLNSGGQAHPISDGFQKASPEPNESVSGLLGKSIPEAPQEQALRTAQINAAKPVSEGGLGLRPDNTPMERAKAMGGIEAYSGTKNDIQNIDLSKSGVSDPGLVGSAFYSTPLAEQASNFATSPHYGRGDSPNVMPLMLLPRKTAISQDGQLLGKSLSDIHPLGITKKTAAKINKDLKKSGYDTVQFNLGNDPLQYASLDPITIRSRFAAFDPARRNEADLLAGVAPYAIPAGLLGLLMANQGPVNYD